MNTDEHIFMDMDMVFRDNGRFIHIHFSRQELIEMQIRINEVLDMTDF